MDPLAPILPALVLGTIAHFLRGKWKLWITPVTAFILSFLLLFLSLPSPSCPPPPPTVEIVVCNPPAVPLSSVLLTSLYFSLLALLFHAVGVALDRLVERYLSNPWIRAVVVTYITLLLLQLWVEVFPWTVALPWRFS